VFSEAVDKTVSFAKDAQSVSTSLQEQSKKTVGQWSASIAEIQDEGLRRSAQESKEEYNKSFEESRSSSDNAFKKAEIYISKIEDARRSLKVNLSVDGIKNLKSFAKTTETSGTEAVSALKSAGDLAVKATARIAPASTVAGKK
ncbi:MAG: hypothetical protein LBV54_08900, partial [Puniceicoccales bacterium]|jgi:hypothetical protein|nr:hypothetical protein [Puniceicoccales bacterium]